MATEREPIPRHAERRRPVVERIAVFILLDATVVRGVLVPAVMRLLGERNWYLPRWLAWLPAVKLEGAASTPAAGWSERVRA